MVSLLHATSVPAVPTKPFPGWDCPGPLADQVPKFHQVFGKPPFFLRQMFAPFTPGELRPAASRELQRGRGTNVSLPGDLSHCCPSSALSPGRGSAHRSCLDQEVASLPFQRPGVGQSWGAFFQPTHTCQTSHICGGGAMASIGAQGHCLCTTFLGLSCPRNPTPVPCPLPEPGSPSPWDSCQASPVSKNPLTQHVDPILGLRQHEGTAHRSRMLGDK